MGVEKYRKRLLVCAFIHFDISSRKFMFHIIQAKSLHYLIAFGEIYFSTLLNRNVDILRVAYYFTLHIVHTDTLCV